QRDPATAGAPMLRERGSIRNPAWCQSAFRQRVVQARVALGARAVVDDGARGGATDAPRVEAIPFGCSARWIDQHGATPAAFGRSRARREQVSPADCTFCGHTLRRDCPDRQEKSEDRKERNGGLMASYGTAQPASAATSIVGLIRRRTGGTNSWPRYQHGFPRRVPRDRRSDSHALGAE